MLGVNIQKYDLRLVKKSGKPDPSEDDIKITKQIISAGEILGIEVMDHLIIGDGNCFISMKEKELI